MYKMIHVTNDTSKKDSTPILAKIPGKRYVHFIQFESMYHMIHGRLTEPFTGGNLWKDMLILDCSTANSLLCSQQQFLRQSKQTPLHLLDHSQSTLIPET